MRTTRLPCGTFICPPSAVSTDGGEMMEGHMHYPKGGMGVHFVNLTVTGAPDPMRPNVLIYEPTDEGLRLVCSGVAGSFGAGNEAAKPLRSGIPGPHGRALSPDPH